MFADYNDIKRYQTLWSETYKLSVEVVRDVQRGRRSSITYPLRQPEDMQGIFERLL